jgi:soluble lytic murein transglycosylase-like protein
MTFCLLVTAGQAHSKDSTDMQRILSEAQSLYSIIARVNKGRRASGPSPFTHTNPKAIRPTYSDLITQSARDFALPENLIAAVIKCESNWQPRALSHAGARGLMQIMPGTAKGEFGLEAHHLWDPKTNIRAGSAYLRSLANRYGGDPERTLQAYNAGPGRLASGKPLPLETRQYSECVRRWYNRYQSRQR